MNSEMPEPIPHFETTSSMRKTRYEPAKSWTRIARTQNIFVRKWTWPSGRVTAGSRSVSGFSAYSRLFFFSSRGIGLLPGVPWEDDLAATAGDLRDGRRRGLRDGDPHCHRYATRA